MSEQKFLSNSKIKKLGREGISKLDIEGKR